jgi:hypothetical protein
MKSMLTGCTAIVIAACSTPAGSHGPAQVEVDSGTNSAVTAAAITLPAGARLRYYGGPVISNVKVYVVFWGPNVTPQVQSQIGDFYRDITNSPYFDWLNEFNTTITPVGGGAGTNQAIGRGTYAGAITITPAHLSGKVDMTQISAEVVAQLTAGHLPAPDDNTLFMIYMPPSVTVTDGSDIYCTASGSCANHTAVSYHGKLVPYGVLPDFGPGSGCQQGCGNAPDFFGNLTGNSAHELIESVTDPDVDQGDNAAPMAWNDPVNDEIGDICDNDDAQFTTGGATYWVQNEFSNLSKACLLTRTNAVDFAIDVAPSSLALAAGASLTATIHAVSTAGSPGSLTLSSGALPAGVTVAFHPPTVAAGGTATATITAASTAANVTDFVLAVRATAGASVHTASTLLDIGPASGMSDAGVSDPTDAPSSGSDFPNGPGAASHGCSAGGSSGTPCWVAFLLLTWRTRARRRRSDRRSVA